MSLYWNVKTLFKIEIWFFQFLAFYKDSSLDASATVTIKNVDGNEETLYVSQSQHLHFHFWFYERRPSGDNSNHQFEIRILPTLFLIQTPSE